MASRWPVPIAGASNLESTWEHPAPWKPKQLACNSEMPTKERTQRCRRGAGASGSAFHTPTKQGAQSRTGTVPFKDTGEPVKRHRRTSQGGEPVASIVACVINIRIGILTLSQKQKHTNTQTFSFIHTQETHRNGSKHLGEPGHSRDTHWYSSRCRLRLWRRWPPLSRPPCVPSGSRVAC